MFYSYTLVHLDIKIMDKVCVYYLPLNVLLDIPMTKKKRYKTVSLAIVVTKMMVKTFVFNSVHHALLDIRIAVLENVSICSINALKDLRTMELELVLLKVELVEPTFTLMEMLTVLSSSKSISISSS